MRKNKLIKTAIILTLLFSAVNCGKNTAEKYAKISVSESGIEAAEPSIAADTNGNIFVVYVRHDAQKNADVFLQKVDAGGSLTGEKVRVNPLEGSAAAWRGDPPTIKIGNDGTLYVGWTAKVENAENPGARTLFLSVSRDGGKSFESPVKVNDDIAPASHGMHSLAVGNDNSIYLAWLDERNVKTPEKAANIEAEQPADGEFRFIKAHHTPEKEAASTPVTKEEKEPNSEVFFAVSKDGGRSFSANKKLAGDVCPCCKTNLAVDSKGRVFASWRQVLPGDFRHIAVASSENGGADFSPPTVVSDDRWQLNACPVSGAPMAFDSADNLQIFWFTAGAAGQAGLYRAISKDGGKSFSERSLVSNEAISGTPSVIAGADKKVRVFWTSSDKIFVSAPDAEQNAANSTAETVAGKLPAAANLNGKNYVAFIDDEGGKHTVWLSFEK